VLCLFVAGLAPAGFAEVSFDTDVRPILEANCFGCHGPENQKAELRLDLEDAALRGGKSGPAIVIGDADGSRLIQLVAGQDPNLVMPLEGERLAVEQVAVLKQWITEGAVWSAAAPAPEAAPPAETPKTPESTAPEDAPPAETPPAADAKPEPEAVPAAEAQPEAVPAAGTSVFETEIQPILSKRCFTCHGPEKQKSGLRLDLQETAMHGGDSGAVIVAGDPDNSLLIQLVSGADPDRQMPPKGDLLAADQIAALKAWIAAGAEWSQAASDAPVQVASDHWAFQTPVCPDVPAVQNADWPGNDIDRFILAKLESEGVAPSPEADKVTLVRRLYYDLIGIPPTPEEVDQFVADDSPSAYPRMVNKLLASEHFGERWGRYWLDLARYADSDGYEKDGVRPYAYRYRDWVIEALNRDMPYDQFVIQQLAGDLLPGADTDELMATGFHRNTLTNKEGGIDPEEDRVKQTIDRANTTAAVFTGLTMGCAECHSHKYDPISQREYYEFYAFFNAAMEKDVPAPLPGEEMAYEQALARFNNQVGELRKVVDDYRAKLAEKLPEWEAGLDVPPEGWTVLDPVSYTSNGGSEFQELEDKSLLVAGALAPKDKYTIIASSREIGLKTFRLEALTHDSLSNKGPGRAANGNFVLGEFEVYAAPANEPNNMTKIGLVRPKADFEEPEHEAALAIDGNPDSGWAIYRDGGFNEDRYATFETDEGIGYPDGTVLTFVLDHRYGRAHNIGRVRLSVSKLPADTIQFSDQVYAALKTPIEERTEEHKTALLDYYSNLDPKYRELRAPLDELLKAKPQPPGTIAQALVRSPDPPKTFIHLRGDFLSKGDEVQPGVPAVLPPLEPRGETPDRLDLARWIVDPDNPLTPRVYVNRLWQRLFGRGIVGTPDDFGTRSEAPSHPKLLDWLSTEAVARGWSTKDMIRLIVNSSTYKQSSDVRPELYDRDPANTLLARQSRYHVEAEITRDAYLAASGLLNTAVGGPSIRPPQPAGVADLGYAGSIKWTEDTGPEKYRRGLYIFFQRTVPYPMLMTFDCPDSNTASVKRNRSNTPLQALTLLNDPVFFECAQALGGRILTEAPQDEDGRIQFAFRQCMGRAPSDVEMARLKQFLADQKSAFEADPEAAKKFATQHVPEGVEAPESATYVALARVIMNLDEFITRE
jgi:mono/diheme cytochrome c family protein